ncbi:cadherin-like beta sandwich domain-containing protein [Paenibacillus qinlingensis]|uniref:cadherin-like beta sandwich domain-containing protein n=1 Tax=Paenibacillus qinlingensis TaxID=1837343 RepID=UPI0015634D65|nr:cadherin-like beta sandwich domain-containing protein [Paenibacillus qinlingensis]NQX61313.1 cadherin-like beta sandwich domain-containing protein [Paenibacillus qinlingensis]
MDIIRSSPGRRQIVRTFLATVLFTTIILTAISIYSQTVFAASDWRMGAGGSGDPAALGFDPFGLDVDPVNGYFFVTDESNFAVKIFDSNGTAAGTLTASSGSFMEPLAIKLDGAGHIYVTDKWYLYRFDVTFSSGVYTFSNMIKWDGSSVNPSVGRLDYAQGIAVYGNDLYIADTNNNRVLKFDAHDFSSTSSPEIWSGDLDSDPIINATIDNPFGIAADSSGVYIGNNRNNSAGKIIKLKTDGSTWIRTINAPKGFSLHTDGYLYVAVNGSAGSLVTRFDSSLNENSVYFTGNSNAIAPANVGFDYTGALYLSTYAQMVGYESYNTIWKQSLGSPDNRLSGLTASGVTVNPSPFSPNTQDYTASVASNVTTTTVTPVLSDTTASVTVNGTSVTSGSASSSITLSKGYNTIPVVVTAINGAKRTYTIKVNRAPYTDAALSGLTVSNGTLNQTFDTGTFAYTATVANNVTSVDVTPTFANSRATLKVNNVQATSGSPFAVSSLVVGPNTITVSVTAEDGTTMQDYTIMVTREPSAIATLSALLISPGAFRETFASGRTTYTADVANNVYEMNVTPTVTDGMSSLKVNDVASVSGAVYGPIPLAVGANTITLLVTAQDGTTTTSYSIIVTRAPSSEATLSALTISPGTFQETFTSGRTAYTASVANDVTEITVTPTVTDSLSSLKVNDVASVSGAVYGPIPLAVGANTITLLVTAQDGTTTTSYSIIVTRAPSSEATLSALTISLGALNETFAAETLAYTVNVEPNVSSISVTPVSTESHATLIMNGIPAATGSAFGPIALNPGSNTVTIVVTAQDGITQKSYRLDIIRSVSNESTEPVFNAADLDSLSLLADEETLVLSPTFKSDIRSYTAKTAAKKIHFTAKTIYMDAKVSLLGKNLQEEAEIELHPGDNTVALQVTHISGLSQTYTITIYRTTTEALPVQPAGLNDIAGNWAEAEIRRAVAQGWVAGYPDGSFHPEREVTRAEFVQLLAKSLGWKQPEAGSLPGYADVDDIGLWARPAISMALQLGIINGYEDGSFRPNRSLTRAEMTMLIVRSLGLTVEMNQSTSFADNSSIPSWALAYIAEAAKQGLVNGLDNNLFGPNSTATRAQAVVILTRLMARE